MRNCSLNLKFLACFVIFLAVIPLSCKPKSPEETDAGKSTVPADSGPDIAVTVNGVDVLESDIEKLVKPQLEMIAKQSAELPPKFAEQYTKQLREQFVEQTIRRILLDEKVKQANIVITDEEVMSMIEEITTSQKEPLTIEEFKKKMAEYGQSFDEVKMEIREGLARNKFMQPYWEGKTNITEEEAQKYYNENPKFFNKPELARVSHILITPEFIDPNSDPNADPNEAKAIARKKAEDLLEQIKGGADFAELAKIHSNCPMAPQGGDLGFFSRGEMDSAFENVAFELGIGQISDVVETKYGYHIIKATGHTDASTIPFEKVKDKIVEQLTQEKQSELAEEYIQKLKDAANITYPAGKEPSSQTNNP